MAASNCCGLDKQTTIIISVILTIALALTIGQVLFLSLTSCRNKNDIMFMMDDSKSVSDEDFQKAKNFILEIANSKNLTINKNKGNIATGSFSKSAGWMDTLENHYMYDPNVIKVQLDNYARLDCTDSTFFTPVSERGCTNTIAALDFVNDNMIRSRKGFKTLIFVTDGGSNMNSKRQDINLIESSAEAIKDQGTEVYTIRVGESEKHKEDDDAEMFAIASGNSVEEKAAYMYQVDSFEELNDLVGEFSDKLCSKNWWLVSIPLLVAFIFIGIKLGLNYCEHKKFQSEEAEAEKMNRTELA